MDRVMQRDGQSARIAEVTLGLKLKAVALREGVQPQRARGSRRKDPLPHADAQRVSNEYKAKNRNAIAAHFRNKRAMQGELALTVASLMLGVHIEVSPPPPV